MTDSTTFYKNIRRLFPPDKQRPYLGQIIAWSEDGTRVIAHAADYDDLFAELHRLGVGELEFVVDSSLASQAPFPNGSTGRP